MDKDIRPDTNWKIQALLVGTALGALTGLGAAYLLTRRAEKRGKKLALTSRQSLKIGMLLAGLLQQILRLGDE
ncbi:MAG: hypothetical protein ACUVRJ_10245 [Candidatus Villigracilaceae bacterium]